LARYEPRVLPQLEAALARREPVREAVAALRPHVMGAGELATFGDPERILFNVNDAADLARAEQLLGV
jgi:molybdopterin-guanine dinucleotide biosynthesis protein A